MAFKLKGVAPDKTKMYLQPVAAAAAVGSRQYEYVSADTPAAVENCGYISNATEDGKLAMNMLHVGDMIWVFQVASIDDGRSISEDKSHGIVDVSLHVVLVKTAAIINLSDDLLAGTVSYTS